MFIAIDFDGTIVDHRFPKIGDPVPGALEWILKFKEAGATLILWTMRSDTEEGDLLSQAVAYCQANGVDFDFVNEHPQDWTTSPKAFAHVYIDDSAFGCPLVKNKRFLGRPYVDWEIVGPEILAQIG